MINSDFHKFAWPCPVHCVVNIVKHTALRYNMLLGLLTCLSVRALGRSVDYWWLDQPKLRQISHFLQFLQSIFWVFTFDLTSPDWDNSLTSWSFPIPNIDSGPVLPTQPQGQTACQKAREVTTNPPFNHCHYHLPSSYKVLIWGEVMLSAHVSAIVGRHLKEQTQFCPASHFTYSAWYTWSHT